jgi:hypothetical protein
MPEIWPTMVHLSRQHQFASYLGAGMVEAHGYPLTIWPQLYNRPMQCENQFQLKCTLHIHNCHNKQRPAFNKQSRNRKHPCIVMHPPPKKKWWGRRRIKQGRPMLYIRYLEGGQSPFRTV